MCLTDITERIKKPSSMIQDGWKLFGGTHDKPRFEFMALAGNYEVPLDQWLKARGAEIDSTHGGNYRASFHVYDEDQAPTHGTPRRVYVRGVHTIGLQDGKRIMIAEEMYVPSDPESWPPGSTASSAPPPSGPQNKAGGVLGKLQRAVGKTGNA